MKVLKNKMRKVTITPVIFGLIVAPVLFSAASFAADQEDPLFANVDSVYNSDQVDVDGTFAKKPQKTAADKLKEKAAEIKRKTDEYVDNQIEEKRLAKEQEVAKELENMFAGKALPLASSEGSNMQQREDVVSVKASAVQTVEAPASAPSSSGLYNPGDLRIIPSGGMTVIQGDRIDLQSKLAAGIGLSAMVTNRVSVGVGFQYMNLTTKDLNSSSNLANNYWYSSQYGQTREMEYKEFSGLINSKFYLAVESRVRPYVGLGVTYKKSDLKYAQNQTVTYNAVKYGDESYASSRIGGMANLGAEFFFTKNIGMNLDVHYSHALSSGFAQSSNLETDQNSDQTRLNDVGSRIENSHFYGANLGLVVGF